MNRIFLKLHILVLLLLAASCTNKNTDAATVENDEQIAKSQYIAITQAQFEQSNMELGMLQDAAFPVVVATTGMIDVPPENKAVVNATMGGYIKTTPLIVGDKVKKGQVLVTLENPDFVTLQQQYMETHEQLTYLKSEYDRQVSMKFENITSQKSYLKAESDYKSTVARYKGLEKQLQLLNISTSQVRAGKITSIATIYAPVSGSITAVHVTRGSFVSPATPILEIVDNDHIHLELSVFEKDVLQIKKGQEIIFKIPEASTASYKAQVYLVGTMINSNRTIQVHAHMENEDDNQFLLGMFVEAGIVTSSAFAKALPQDAIVQVNNVDYALVLHKKSGKTLELKQVAVKVLNRNEEFVSIANDPAFDEKTQFLTKGAFKLIGE